MSHRLGDRDAVSGYILIGLGAAAIWYAHRYPLGTLNDMGPGYFPLILAVLLLCFGLGTLIEALLIKDRTRIEPIALRPLLVVTGSSFAFALLLDRIGLPLTVLVASIVASAARPRFMLPANFLLAVILAALSVIVFVHALGIPMQVLPTGLQGR